MSDSTPSPEDPGGARPGGQPGEAEAAGSSQAESFGIPPSQDAGPVPGSAPQPGYGTPPGTSPQPGYGTQPGYAAPAGYGPQAGYGTQPGYGYGQPGGSYPAPPPRHRGRMWLGIIGGIVVLAVVIAGVSAYILNKSKKWMLTAPPTVAGMSRDSDPLSEGFGAAVAKFRSDVTSLHNYGHLDSTVSSIYTLGSSQAVGFIGFNGTFNVQVVLKSANGLKVSSVSAGPHGGVAECGTSTLETICQWSTGTTVGILVIIPDGTSANSESVSAADKLMIKVRDDVEKPAHHS
jgi:hypothetical protein